MTEEEIETRTVRYKKRVERRAKYLATLTRTQRRKRDDYIAWVRWWRKEYKELVTQISHTKHFMRNQGHNNLLSLKSAMARLEKLKRKARALLYARKASKEEHQQKE